MLYNVSVKTSFGYGLEENNLIKYGMRNVVLTVLLRSFRNNGEQERKAIFIFR